MARKTWASGDVLTATDLNTLVVQAAPGSSRTLHIGTYSGTTDATGRLTLTHGAGFTPTAVFFTINSAGGGNQTGIIGTETLGATTVVLRFLSASALHADGYYLVLA